MNKVILTLLIGIVFNGLRLVYAQGKPVIEVIVSDAEVVVGRDALIQQGFEVKLYNLDEPKRLLARLAQNLPPNQDAAKKTLEQRFQTLGQSTVQQQFESAYQAMIVATQYGVNRYPAVVFDQGQAVIYGVTDLNQALTLYQQWQGEVEK